MVRNVNVRNMIKVRAPCFIPTMNKLTFVKGFVPLEAVKKRSSSSLWLVDDVLAMVEVHVYIRVIFEMACSGSSRRVR